MRNEEIIFKESLKLMQSGKIGSTGRKMIFTNADGEKMEVLEPESIHTYAGWKAHGRQVKRGEKSIATIVIWKQVKKKKKGEEENKTEETEVMFLTKAFFFRECQTEEIKEVK